MNEKRIRVEMKKQILQLNTDRLLAQIYVYVLSHLERYMKNVGRWVARMIFICKIRESKISTNSKIKQMRISDKSENHTQ